jgi:hypothetical protein
VPPRRLNHTCCGWSSSMPSEQLRQLGDVGRDAPRFIAREQIGRCASSGLGLEIDVSQRLTVVVADDETTALVFLYVPRWRKAARRGQPRSTVTTLSGSRGSPGRIKRKSVAMRSVREGPPRFWRPTRRLVQSRLAYPDQVQQEPSARLRPFAVRSASSDWPLVNSPTHKPSSSETSPFQWPQSCPCACTVETTNTAAASPAPAAYRWFVGRAQSLRWSKVAGSGARRA